MCLLAPFILQNLKRIVRADPELSGCAIFGHKMAHLFWTFFFLVQTIITFIYLLAIFIVQNLQKTLTADPKLWGCPSLDPKWSICPTIIFLENY